jgi:hypothetical protein
MSRPSLDDSRDVRNGVIFNIEAQKAVQFGDSRVGRNPRTGYSRAIEPTVVRFGKANWSAESASGHKQPQTFATATAELASIPDAKARCC